MSPVSLPLLLSIVSAAFVLIDSLKIVKFDSKEDIAEAHRGIRVCRSHQLNRNARDIYPNPDDCHSFYKCYFSNNATHVIGLLQPCPQQHFWNVDLMKCVPEGAVPCLDPCRNGTVAFDLRCYSPPHSCAKFYTCVDAVSQVACCSGETRFNPNTCTCQPDRYNHCLDKCVVEKTGKLPRNTLEDVADYNETHCEDQFGNIFEVLPNRPKSYNVVFLAKTLETYVESITTGNTKQNQQSIPSSVTESFIATCPTGSHFELRSCRCRRVAIPQVPPATGETVSRQCSLYLPFDEDSDDYSENGYATYLFDNAELTQTFAARGSGSLLLRGGRVEIPQFSTNVDLLDSASWCLFFQCHNSEDEGGNPFACSQSGGLLSNRLRGSRGLDYSISLGVRPTEKLVARITYEHPDYVTSVNVSLDYFTNYNYNHGGELFNQVCITYDGYYVTLYVNNILMSKTPATGFVRLTSSMYYLGTDGLLGEFHGYIDEVLVCRHAMTQAEVNAHFKGQDAMKEVGLIP